MTTQTADLFLGTNLFGAVYASLPQLPHASIVPDPNGSNMLSTANRGGYEAEWRLLDNKLYLSALSGAFRLASASPVFADWIEGWLFVDHGEIVTEHYYPRQPVYGHCTALRFLQGVLQRQVEWHAGDRREVDAMIARDQFIFETRDLE